MWIECLELEHFRSYENASLHFDPGMNIIYGQNAQGKTNILEALYLCATSKSHRTANTREMVKFGYDESHIAMDISKDHHREKIDFHLKKHNKKAVAINKVPIRRMNELFGVLRVIMFSPEDLGLIKSGPKERRRFMDLELCQLNPIYYHNLKQYYQVLKQRNNLLKQLKKDESLMDQIEIWDDQLVAYGRKIIGMREKFIADLNPFFSKNHLHISGQKEQIEMIYEKSCDESQFAQRLIKARKSDIFIGSTSVGPHKDDLQFMLSDMDLRRYGSQGQHRTAALSLKLSEIDLMKQMTDEKPILLLDDVLSELDRHRQGFLIQHIHECQTIMTCTGVEDFLKSEFSHIRMFHVDEGKISQEQDLS